jgi:PAS domain S-box-containing protein
MMKQPLRVLIIDDSEDDTLLLVEELRRGDYDVTFEQVYTESTLRAALDNREWDVILSDHSMPQFSGLVALQIVKERALDIPFIIVSGTMSEDAAVDSMKLGAADYFSKNKVTRLIPAVERELRDADHRRQRQRAEQDLRRAETALRQREASLEEAQRIAQLGNWNWNLETNEVHWSSGLHRIFEVPTDKPPMNLEEFATTIVHPQDRERLRDAIARAAELREPFDIEYRIVLSERGERVILSRGEVKTNEAGAPVHMLGTIQDITERKRIETAEHEQRMFAEALRETAAALSTTLELDRVLDLILEHMGWVVPHDASRIALIEGENARVVRHRGYGERGLTTLIPMEDLPHLRWIIKTSEPFSLADTERYTGWKQFPEMAWVRSNLTAPINVMGAVIGFLILDSDTPDVFTAEHARRLQVFADHASVAIQNAQLYEALLHQSVELEQRVAARTRELQQAKDRVEAILNSTSDALVLTNPSGVIEQTTPAFDDEFGYLPDELLGQPLSALIQPEFVESFQAGVQVVLMTQIRQRVELVARRKDGTTFDAEASLSTTAAKEGARIVLCSVRDITHRKQAEVELRTSLEQERELAELRTRFGSMLSHEFRTPLAVIQFSSSILKDYDEKLTPEKRHDHLIKIQAQIKRLVSLLDDFLMVTRSEKVEATFNPVVIEPISFCREIIEETRLFTETHEIGFVVTGECEQAMLDPRLMRQAITNLLTNAIKYSPAGSTVDVTMQCDSHQITIAVRDRGIGIPEADQARLFETFYRANNVGAIPGTGLGLTIIKQAVELHGGTVTFASKVGEGTTFTITIPV